MHHTNEFLGWQSGEFISVPPTERCRGRSLGFYQTLTYSRVINYTVTCKLFASKIHAKQTLIGTTKTYRQRRMRHK